MASVKITTNMQGLTTCGDAIIIKPEEKQLYELDVYRLLIKDILKILNEESYLRPLLYSTGIRDISATIKLKPNNFNVVNEDACELDDARSCKVCKYVCVLSAVACECSQTKVACLRHHKTYAIVQSLVSTCWSGCPWRRSKPTSDTC